MAKKFLVFLLIAATSVLALLATSTHLSATSSPQSPPSAPTSPAQPFAAAAAPSEDRALLNRYCVTCHNEKAKVGGLALATVDVNAPTLQPELWEKVIRKLRGGMMPPPGRPRPDPATLGRFRQRLEAALDTAAAAHPNPGRTETLHRLNRHEYQNAVRDLLGVNEALDIAGLLPVDDQGYGFDTIAGVLKLSPTVIDRHLAAARKVARMAVGVPPALPVAEIYSIPPALRQYDRVEGLPFGTRGGTLVGHYFPQDAEYLFRVSFKCTPIEEAACDPTAGFDDPHTVLLIVDGEIVHRFTLPPTPIIGRLWTNRSMSGDPSRWDLRLPVKGGPHEVGVAFVKLPSYEPTDFARTRWLRPAYEGIQVAAGMGVYQPYISALTITGPFTPSGSPTDTPSRQRIFVCQPKQPQDESRCAKEIVSTLARRGYRRPVAEPEVQELLGFYDAGRKEGGNFDAGIEAAIQALLMSPDFLFRIEADPGTPLGTLRKVAAGPSDKAAPAIYRIGDLELASRLSFFLWSTIPDEELVTVAAQGKLKDPAVFDRQVRRMIEDPRARALTDNFLTQWLQLPKLEELVSPAVDLFPNWDDSLRRAMNQETKLFFDSILREDRSPMELLTANYTFVNERLALHYGIPGIKGEHFRRITLADDSPRRGLLGQASILTLTSHATRTSPTVRGKFILENLLGAPPPPPPPNVPALPETKVAASRSMRERMAAHRRNAVCAGCHASIDPAGFALENFDAVGRWRDLDESFSPIDPSGSLPDGTAFKNLTEFRDALTSHPDRFVTTLTEMMLTYALGRGLEFYDMPAVRAITRDVARSPRMSSLILGIVKSVPFQMRRVEGSQPDSAAGTRASVAR